MKRLLPVFLFALIAGFSIWMLSGGGDAPQPDPGQPIAVETPAAVDARQGESAPAVATVTKRRAVDVGAIVPPDSDPRFEAALAGFRGRVLDAQRRPVADTEVRLYRGDIDSVINQGVDVFVDTLQAEPGIDAGETRTDDEGRFEFHRVSPRAFHLLHAACDHDDPTWRFVQQSPGPGEVIDLGDIVLEQLGVLTGSVVGPEGQPLPGALVRAADLPGTVLGFVPVERLDPEGGLIVTEYNEMVITAPPWFAERFEQLPVPRSLTGADGRFRLTGVYPGSNLVAVTKRGLQSNVRPRILVEAGQERDLGTLRMPEGEYAYGKVVDQQGEPIQGAQVLAASESIGAPVHFASFTAPTDADGVFELGGFPSRNAIVAARRDAGEPWVVSDAQSIGQDFVITLPSRFDLTLRVTDSKGEPVVVDRLQVLAGDPDRGALEMAMWGVTKPVALDGHLQRLEDGRLRIEDLAEGRYALVVAAEGYATKAMELKLDADEEHSLELGPSLSFRVRVLDPDGEPLRRATVLHMGRGKKLVDFPRHAGRTDAEGEVEVSDAGSESVEVYARYPEFGTIEGRAELPTEETLLLQFAKPAAIEGTLTANGATPPAGEWTLILSPRGGADGAMPRTTLADAKGQFAFRGLQPGKYTLTGIDSLDAIRSFGSIAKMTENMFSFGGGGPQTMRLELEPGATEQVAYDLLRRPEDNSPKVQITGFATVDGMPAAGYRISGWGNRGSVKAELDAQGRFDLGMVRVGNLNLRLLPPERDKQRHGPNSREAIWSTRMELAEGGIYDLSIDVETTGIAGLVLGPNGLPAPDVAIDCFATSADQPPDGSTPHTHMGGGSALRFNTISDASGLFEFEGIPAATYRLTAKSERAAGDISEISALAGAPQTGLQLQLHSTYVVRGTVEFDDVDDDPRFVMVYLQREEGGQSYHANPHVGDGSPTFELTGVEPGSYKAYVQSDPFSSGSPRRHPDLIHVHGDIDGLILRPTEIPEQD